MEESPKVGIAVFVLKGGKILMLKRKGSHGEGTWALPGGKLEFGESFFDTAIREVEEECGLKVSNPRFVCITNDIFEEGKHYITVYIATDYVSGEAKIMEKQKASGMGWFNLDKLPQPLFLSTQNLVSNNCFPKNWRENLQDPKA